MFAAGFRANEYINNKTERDLRDRLEIKKEVKGSLSTLPNEALKQKTLDLIANMRELLASENEEQLAIRQRYEDKIKHLGPEYSELDEPVLQEAWSEMGTAYAASLSNTIRLYEERYEVDAALLREELISRLPEEITQRDDILQGDKAFRYYHSGYNSGIVESIALDLETLAKLLPK